MAWFLARFLLAGLALLASSAATSPLAWQPWQHLAGVFDLAGPRNDGRLVAAANGRLFLVSADGTVTPFAAGPGGYNVAAGPEAYLDVSPGQHVSGSGCDFTRDDVFVLRPGAPFGVTRVDAAGQASNFVDIAGVDSLNGIVFDRVGRFDHRLLVSGPHGHQTSVLAIDCKGGIVPITYSAPPVEGGLAVAPAGFGTHGGDLIAPDENTGKVWAISAAGATSLLVAPAIAHGGDIGVESAGFVPSGFTTPGGFAEVADRATPGNPHPGTDTILRLPSADLAAAGVRDGDLLIASEGGAVLIDIRCLSSCGATTVVATATTAHVEGHLVVLAPNRAPTTPSPLPAVSDLGSQRAQQLFRIVAILLALAVLAAALVLRRLRRRPR